MSAFFLYIIHIMNINEKFINFFLFNLKRSIDVNRDCCYHRNLNCTRVSWSPYVCTSVSSCLSVCLFIYPHWRVLIERNSLSVDDYMLYFDLRPGPKILFQGNTPEGSDSFQWPVIERNRVGGLRLMIWDKVKVLLCHYSHAPEESNLWTA